MANFPTRANWHTQIRRIEAGDSVIGGENAPINLCLGGLAERTDWLKTEIARAVALIGTNQTTADQKYALKTTQINAGAGLTGGGVLRDNTTISMGTPSKITATSQNSVVSNTHTHEIDKASTNAMGIVQLSSATNSAAENLAATPKAIKAAFDRASLITVSGAQDANQIALTGVPAAVCNVNTPKAGYWYILNISYNDKGGNVGQIAWQCLANQAQELWTRAKYGSTWSNWTRIDGTDWAGVRDKPDTFAGYGLTGSQTYDGQLTFTSGNYPAVILSPANSQNKWYWEANSDNAYFIHRTKVGDENIKIIHLPARAGTLALANETVNLAGNQTINGQKTFANQLKINNGAVMTYAGWSNHLQFDGAPAAITLEGRYAIGLHSNGNLYLFDNDQRAYGLTYNYAAKSLNVVGEVTSGSHHLTRKADRATTLAGYGITDGVTPTQLQAAVAGIVSSSPAALDTLRELAAALGNDPNYAATTARKLGEAAPSGTITYFAGERAPQGWLIRNGAEISRTVYAKLFAVIGTRFGAGNGSTTFNLPDDRGGFDRAWDGGRGIDSGRTFGSWQGDAIRNITGIIPTASWAKEGGGAFRRLRTGEQDGDSGGRNGWVYDFDASRVVPTASENRPVNRAWLPIIKI